METGTEQPINIRDIVEKVAPQGREQGIKNGATLTDLGFYDKVVERAVNSSDKDRALTILHEAKDYQAA